MSWINFIDQSAKHYPNKVAIIDQPSKRRVTYADLVKETNGWAYYFLKRGVKHGDRVAFLATNCLEHLTLFFACARLGAIFVPLNFRLAKIEQEEIINRIQPTLFLGFGSCHLEVSCGYDDIEGFIPSQSYKFTFPQIPLEQPLLMLFTSGTTGSPKGVLIHGQMLSANQINTCHEWNLDSQDTTLVETPFFHTGGYNVLCLPLLYLGGTVVIATKFHLENVFDTIEKENVTVYFGVPTMFQMMVEEPCFEFFNFNSIRFLISGGAHCPIETINAFLKKGIMFKQGFGLTEIGPNCFLLKEEEAITKLGSIGRPMPHSKVLILTEDGNHAKAGEVGELLIKGPHLCRGYYQQTSRFESCKHKGFFKTGDLAKFDTDGYYFIVGRKKDMYISGGENVYPAEVEKNIITHPQVKDVVVVAVASKVWGEVGMAFIKSENDLELEELEVYLGPRLSRYKHPKYLKNIHKFPLLSSGKVDRGQLKKNAQQEFDL